MLSFLLSLCLAHQPDGLLEVVERKDPIIYVANPTYGGTTTRRQVLDPIILSVAPGHANSTFLKGYKDINIYVGANIGSLTGCDYEADPLYCSLENDHWVLTTFINETPDTAVLVMTLYDNRGMIIGTSTRTKRAVEKCDVTQKETQIRGNGPKGAYSQKIEESQTGECRNVAPLIDYHMINQTVMSLYLGVK
jgi:hypothetical protein